MTWYRTLGVVSIDLDRDEKVWSVPLLILKGIHLGPTLEQPRLAVGLLQSLLHRPFIALLQLHQLIRRHAHHQPSDVVEAAQPYLSCVIANVDAHNVTMVRTWVRLVAFLAAPLSRLILDHLLVAALGKAGRVREIIWLHVDDGGTRSEIVRCIGHAKVFLFDLENGLGRIATPSSCVHCPAH